MPELPAQPDDIDVERIMEQVRARVEERCAAEAAVERERRRAEAERAHAEERKRAEERERAEEVRARAELEHERAEKESGRRGAALLPSESFAFDGNSIYWSSRGGVGRVLQGIRRLLRPLLKFVFNIDPMVHALATQARLNAQQAAFDDDVARRVAAREAQDAFNRRVVESLTAELERLASDMKSQRTLVAAVVDRLDALERARAGEGAGKPRGGRQTDERPHRDAPASPPAARATPPSDRQTDERPDDDLPAPPAAAATPPSDRQTDERPHRDAPASPPAARATPPGDRQTDERPDDDLPAPPAAAAPPPNR